MTLAKRRSALLIWLCSLVYFVSYLTRINYAAALSEIVAKLQVSNAFASLAVTGSFITYGLGQTLCGFLGDSISPRRMIATGLVTTSLCNLLMPMMPTIYWMAGIWSINGFFQSMLWPPMMRILAENLAEADFRRACIAVSTASAIATIVVYLLVPACIWISGWQLAFFIPGVFGIAITLVWLVGTRSYSEGDRTGFLRRAATALNAQAPGLWTLIRRSSLLPLMVVIILQGTLRDGIATWMPTYINDRYQLGTSLSILASAILPLFHIISVTAVSAIQKRISNEVAVAAIMFATGAAAAIGLRLFFFSSPVFSVSCMALVTGSMHGVNTMLISRVPRHFSPYGRVATISGLLNTFTYVGSALSSYGIAEVSDRWGWFFTVALWAGIALAGTLICALCIRRWNRFCAVSASKLLF